VWAPAEVELRERALQAACGLNHTAVLVQLG
jgi:hypothetical protein